MKMLSLMRMLLLFSALVTAQSIQAQSTPETAVPESLHPFIITIGVSLVNGRGGIEYQLKNQVHLVINGGAGMNYLLGGNDYSTFRAYPKANQLVRK